MAKDQRVNQISKVAEKIAAEIFSSSNGIDVIYDLLNNNWVKDCKSHREYAVELLGFEPERDEMITAWELINNDK